MASNYLTTGIKINVDATDFDTKFAKMAEELNRTLTKSQKSLGLQYDANQRLVNSQGQVVEGLSQAQIKLGQYVDELGRVRTYQDGFAAGLSRSEQELGFFADALGNVYSRSGALIRESQEVARATEEISQHFRDARGAVGDLGSQVAMVFSNLAGLSDETKTAAATMVALGEATSVAVDVSNYVGELSAGIRGIGAAAGGASNGVEAFGAVTAAMAGPGGWVALGVGALAGLTVGLTSFMTAAQANEKVVNELGISFEELRRRARESGEEIKNVSDILANAGKAGLAGFGAQVESLKKIAQLQSQIAANEARKSTPINMGVGSGSAVADYERQNKKYEEQIQTEIDSLGQWLLQVEAGFVTEEEKLQEQIKLIDRFIELERSRGATEARINEITETREKVAQKLKDAQTREAQAAKDKAATEAQRALEARRKLEEERKQKVRDSINLGGLEGAISAARQENLTFSPETFYKDVERLNQLVAEGIFEQEDANAIINAAYLRNAEAAQKEAEARTKAAQEAQKRADAERANAERQALQDWGFTGLKAAAEKAVPEVVRFGALYARINADAAAMPGLQDEAKTALLGVNASLAAYFDKTAKAASSTGLDRKGLKALDEEQAKLKKALANREIGEKAYNKAMEQLAAARVREAQRVGQAERDEAAKKKKAEEEAATREKASKQAERRREAEAYLDSLKTPEEKYRETIERLEKERKDGVIESREDLEALKDKALRDYQAKLPTVDPEKFAAQAANRNGNDYGQMLLDAMKRRDAGTASASAGSEKLYEMQIAQRNDRQAQMLASLDNTQIIVRDSFSLLNNLVLSIRQNLENGTDNRQAPVFRGLAAQTVRSYGG